MRELSLGQVDIAPTLIASEPFAASVVHAGPAGQQLQPTADSAHE